MDPVAVVKCPVKPVLCLFCSILYHFHFFFFSLMKVEGTWQHHVEMDMVKTNVVMKEEAVMAYRVKEDECGVVGDKDNHTAGRGIASSSSPSSW